MNTNSLPRFLKFLTSLSMGFGLLVMTFWVAFVMLAGFGVFAGLDRASVWTRVSWPAYFNLDPEIYDIESELMGDGEIMLSQGTVQFESVNFGSAGVGIEIAIWVLLVAVPILLLLLNLRRIFSTMEIGTPFVRENVKRIRWIAGLLIFSNIVAQLAQARISERMLWGVQANGLEFVYRFDFGFGIVLIALIIFALAEVFRYGLELQTEADLTV